MNTYLRNVYSKPVEQRTIYKRYDNRIHALNGILIYDLFEVFDKLQDDDEYQIYCEQFTDDDSDQDYYSSED